jgi:hypothetical protein
VRYQFTIVTTLTEQLLRRGLLEIAAAELATGNVRGERQDRDTTAVRILEPLHQMEMSRPTAAGAYRQVSRQVRLGPGSKGRDRDPPRRRMTRSARAIAMATLAFALLKPRTAECQARPGRGDHVRAAWAARPKGRVCFLCAQSSPGLDFVQS